MRILYINPNSTAAMTATIAAAARAVAAPDVEIVARTNRQGPPAIQGPEDGAAALPGLIEEVRAAGNDVAAIVIACFDDTGLDEARAVATCPVIGIGEAAFHAAALLGRPYGVVTTLSVSVPVIAANLARYGVAGCVGVRASEVPVLDVAAAEARISETITVALAEDGAEGIVLGCAGMADLPERLARAHGVPVIDGVAAACGLARMLATLRSR
ncbi:aspartate/glutamate racemase family protein [Amaricoccus sp.]|uniref:aspartate/glutamate racemase family protein n=1 Tax=Amaricoccus sp. TaxID=1872485 RepID=UPI002619C46F|nr:aspartate/glutamate racemase family protein [uncultured Amaricoccus sp.]